MAAIEGLPWVQDGIDAAEAESIRYLTQLALNSQRVFHALLGKELDWLPPQPNAWHHPEAIRLIATISAIDEAAALELIDMPFLETLRGHNYEALQLLAYLAESDPADFTELVANPALRNSTDEDVSLIIFLLHLRSKDPEAAGAIQALAWFQDGMGRPKYDNIGFGFYRDPTDFEESTLRALIGMAQRSRKVFMALVTKPWMQDHLTIWEHEVISGITELYARSEELVLKLLGMPFLDSIEMDDDWVLEMLKELRGEMPDAFGALLSHPAFEDGIEDGQVAIVNGVRLELQDPEAGMAINALTWVQDGIEPFEQEAALSLQFSGLQSRGVFSAVMEQSWVQDGLSAAETAAIRWLRTLSQFSLTEAETLELLEMPFLESVDGADAAALRSLAHLNVGSDEYLRQVLSHPYLSDGITGRPCSTRIGLGPGGQGTSGPSGSAPRPGSYLSGQAPRRASSGR